MSKIKADPLALNAIIRAVLKGANTTPEDFKRATLVDSFSMIYHKFPSWAEPAPGDFSILGMLENMHTLHFPNDIGRPPIQVNDFSFLASCKKLKRLDVARTSFTDCSILLQLPPLSYVRLPEKGQLTHLEALERLPKQTKVSFLNPPAPTPPPAVTPPPRKKPEGSETVKAIVEEIKKRTVTDCYRLTVRPGVTPGLTDSKFGGLPYWDPAMPYPVDGAGKKLVLLAQINFDQLQVDEPLPQGGLLQFFIGDDCFGLDCPGGHRVVYHPVINPSVTAEQLRPLRIPTQAETEIFPLANSMAVTMEKTAGYMGPADERFDALFAQVFRAVTGQALEPGMHYWNTLAGRDYDYLYDQLSTDGHHLLGYPYFTQEDPRNGLYETLLFQMDSDDDILWGDCGVGNFFIDLEKLKQRDFSDVFYTWDCC